MHTYILKALWGMDDRLPIEERLRAIKDAGYDGVEHAFTDPFRVRDLCQELGLVHVPMIFANTIEDFTKTLEIVRPSAPLLVTSHTGRDRMTFDEGCRFLERAIAAEDEARVAVAHETHRSRLFFSPWSTGPYLERFPSLKLLADFSHWCVVCESNLDTAAEIVDLACSRTIHIHGRVGYEEGPQVSDPRAPEYQPYVERFERWWDTIRERRDAARAAFLTFTPEYGPPAYLHTLPYTRQPVANLWDICLWAADRARKRWNLPAAKAA